MTNGRTKGSVAEREVAKEVQGWWRQLEPDASFVRTPLSGGWGGPSIRKEFEASGDLMTTAVKFPYAIEVKRREGWSLKSLAKGAPSPVWGWWIQCQVAALEMQKFPMLWFRKSRMEWLVMMPLRRSVFFELPAAGWSSLHGINFGEEFPAIWSAEQVLNSAPILHVPHSLSVRRRLAHQTRSDPSPADPARSSRT